MHFAAKPALSRERESFSGLLTNSRKVRGGLLSPGDTEPDSKSVSPFATCSYVKTKIESAFEEGLVLGGSLTARPMEFLDFESSRQSDGWVPPRRSEPT